MRLISWLLRAFIFFVLFAFALNNQQIVSVNWFFGAEWRAPMVIVVLGVFAGGCVLGVLAMLPGWWRSRKPISEGSSPASDQKKASESEAGTAASELRDGI